MPAAPTPGPAHRRSRGRRGWRGQRPGAGAACGGGYRCSPIRPPWCGLELRGTGERAQPGEDVSCCADTGRRRAAGFHVIDGLTRDLGERGHAGDPPAYDLVPGVVVDDVVNRPFTGAGPAGDEPGSPGQPQAGGDRRPAHPQCRSQIRTGLPGGLADHQPREQTGRNRGQAERGDEIAARPLGPCPPEVLVHHAPAPCRRCCKLLIKASKVTDGWAVPGVRELPASGRCSEPGSIGGTQACAPPTATTRRWRTSTRPPRRSRRRGKTPPEWNAVAASRSPRSASSTESASGSAGSRTELTPRNCPWIRLGRASPPFGTPKARTLRLVTSVHKEQSAARRAGVIAW